MPGTIAASLLLLLSLRVRANIDIIHILAYSPGEQCESSRVCRYEYYSKQTNFDGRHQQTTSVSAEVGVWCSSVGVFGNVKATRYCMSLENVHLGGSLQASRREGADGGEGDAIPVLTPDDTVLHDPPVSPEEFLLSHWFCFIQTVGGKVVAVDYPAADTTEAVNLKKGIAAAFQSNFKGTRTELEEDTMSQHMASYSYRHAVGMTMAYRVVNSSTVIAFAGGVPREDLQVKKQEFIRHIGQSLHYSTGRTLVLLGVGGVKRSHFKHGSYENVLASVPDYQTLKEQEEEEEEETRRRRTTYTPPRTRTSTFNNSAGLSEFRSNGYYRLSLLQCSLSPSQVNSRRKREAGVEAPEGAVKASLRAHINETRVGVQQIQALRKRLPSVQRTLEGLHRGLEDSQAVAKLHRLLHLESKHGCPPGHQPAVAPVLTYLRKLIGSQQQEDRKMRKLLFSLLSSQGSEAAQMALLATLSAAVDEDEETALISHMAFTENPHKDFISHLERMMELRNDRTDPLLLAYGSMARRASSRAEHHLTSYLQAKLQEARKTNNTDTVVHLIYSLGNSASKSAVTVLLEYLHHRADADVQLATVEALRMHTTEIAVQDSFTSVLVSSSEQLAEQITLTLTEGLEHTSSEQTPPRELLLTLVVRALHSHSSRLKELVLHYLEQLASEEGRELTTALKEQILEQDGETPPLSSGNSTHWKRASQWDAVNSVYELVAGYSQRQKDVHSFSHHKAYIWGRRLGVAKLFMQVAAGGFGGIKPDGSGYKVFAKGVAQGHAFGRTATAVHAEFLRRRSGSRVYQKKYIKVAGITLVNEAGYVSKDCADVSLVLLSGSVQLLYTQYSIFVYIGIVDFYVGLYVELSIHLKLSYCEKRAKICASLIPRIALRAEGGAASTIMLALRGGVEVAGQISYQLEPGVCVQYCRGNGKRLSRSCLEVYHAWPTNFIEIYAFYQYQTFKVGPPPRFSWGPPLKWTPLALRWIIFEIPPKLIWRDCDKVADSRYCSPFFSSHATPTTCPTVAMTS